MNNRLILIATLLLMSSVFICSSIFFFLSKVMPNTYEGHLANNQLLYKVEECHLSGKFLTISGWAIRKGVAMNEKTITILVPTTEGIKEYKSILNVRGDASKIANKIFSDKLNYTNSGFKTFAMVKKSNISGKISIKLNSNGESWMSITDCGV